MNLDLEAANKELAGKSPQEIIAWAAALPAVTFASTSFSPNSATMLHLISQAAPQLPVIWVDSGYNVPDTYRVAEQLIDGLPIDMRIYTPIMTAERRNALLGGIPHPDDTPELHQEFTRQVKLEPFDRAVADLQGEVWVTGIRKEETAHRQSLDIVSIDSKGLIKVAPIFNWGEQDIEAYMDTHSLPSCRHYFDPTKVHDSRECGLHTSA